MCDIFNDINKDTRTTLSEVVLVSLQLTLKIIYEFSRNFIADIKQVDAGWDFIQHFFKFNNFQVTSNVKRSIDYEF